MNVAKEDIGSVLYRSYVEQSEHYTAALRLAGEVAAACRRGEAIDDRLTQVLALLAETARRDSLLSPLKQSWEQNSRPNRNALQSLMNRIADLIRQIQSELQTIEQAVQARRDQLAGELDVCNRRCRMQRAYQGKT